MRGKRNRSLLTSSRWLLIFSGGSFKNKRRSETETGESHPDFRDDSKEIQDHAREEGKEASKLLKRKDS